MVPLNWTERKRKNNMKKLLEKIWNKLTGKKPEASDVEKVVKTYEELLKENREIANNILNDFLTSAELEPYPSLTITTSDLRFLAAIYSIGLHEYRHLVINAVVKRGHEVQTIRDDFEEKGLALLVTLRGRKK